MKADNHVDAATELIVQRARDRFKRHLQRTMVGVDRLFAKILIGQWLFGIALAIVISPWAWEGKTQVLHPHIWIAVLLGGAIISFPVVLALRFPGTVFTRHVVAVAQMLFS